MTTEAAWTTARIREAFIDDGGLAEHYDPINGARDQARIAGAIFDKWLVEHDAALEVSSRPARPEREAVIDVLAEALGWDWNRVPLERIPSSRDVLGDVADALLAADLWQPAHEADWEYAHALWMGDGPREFLIHKGPWVEPREPDEGYFLVRRQIGSWAPVPSEGVES